MIDKLLPHITSPTLTPQIARQVYGELGSRYNEPWRHYHTVKHLGEVTGYLIEHVDLLENPRTTLLAAIGHDSVYIPSLHGGKNEELSAQLTEDLLLGHLPDSEVEQIGNYIRATATHDPIGDSDLALMLDADLKILGSSSKAFHTFEQNIRKEYAEFNDKEYAEGRRNILMGFLGRQRIYNSDIAHDEFEQPARQNLRKAIVSLNVKRM